MVSGSLKFNTHSRTVDSRRLCQVRWYDEQGGEHLSPLADNLMTAMAEARSQAVRLKLRIVKADGIVRNAEDYVRSEGDLRKWKTCQFGYPPT